MIRRPAFSFPCPTALTYSDARPRRSSSLRHSLARSTSRRAIVRPSCPIIPPASVGPSPVRQRTEAQCQPPQPRMAAILNGCCTVLRPLSILCVFVFAVLLYVRPLLRQASIDPRRPLRDPYYHAYWTPSSSPACRAPHAPRQCQLPPRRLVRRRRIPPDMDMGDLRRPHPRPRRLRRPTGRPHVQPNLRCVASRATARSVFVSGTFHADSLPCIAHEQPRITSSSCAQTRKTSSSPPTAAGRASASAPTRRTTRPSSSSTSSTCPRAAPPGPRSGPSASRARGRTAARSTSSKARPCLPCLPRSTRAGDD